MTRMTDIPEDAERLGSRLDHAWMRHHHTGDHTVVTITGEFDAYSAAPWRSRFRQVIDDGPGDIILEVEDVDYFDSTSLGVIVGCLKYIRAKRQGCCIRVVPVNSPTFTKTFQTCGLTKVFPFYPDTAAALAAAATDQRVV